MSVSAFPVPCRTMASSPMMPDSGEQSFDDFLKGGAEPGVLFVHSSPIHNNVHPTFEFDLANDSASPFGRFGKTPGAKLKRGGEFLVSPLQPHRLKAIRANGGHEHVASAMGMGHSIPIIPTLNRSSDAFTNLNYHFFPSSPTRHAQTLSPENTTPIQSPKVVTAPSTISRQPRRSVTGLGSPSNVHRSGGDRRQATYAANSMPVSPSLARNHDLHSLHPSHGVSRGPSESYLSAPVFGQERTVSGMSGITTSTSDEQLVSPFLQPTFGPDISMNASQSLPEMMQHQSGSPIARSRSPMQANGVFFTSPEQTQGGFNMSQQQNSQNGHQYDGDMSLMGGVAQVMGNSGYNVQNSTSMASVASFQGQVYRRETGSTMVGTPMLGSREMSYQMTMPSQNGMPSQSQFQQVSYPSVPGVNRYPTGPQNVDIDAWANQTFNAGQGQAYGYSQPGQLQRHASASYLEFGQPQAQQQDNSHLLAPPMLQRSVSAPFEHIGSSMPSMSTMPTVSGTHGLFGSQEGMFATMDDTMFESQTAFSPFNRHASGSASLTTSPETPRSKKRVYPRVGKPMRPGPKPKPKTPKQGVRSSSTASPAEIGSGQGGIDPALLSGKALPSIAEGEEGRRKSFNPATSPKREPLQFGPELSSIPPRLDINPMVPNPSNQPQLVIDPPRTVLGPNGLPVGPGLPKEFLEKLYTTFMTMDGSVTNQPVKRFKCLIEGCERHFPRKSAIHSHIQTHLEDKPFVCPTGDW